MKNWTEKSIESESPFRNSVLCQEPTWGPKVSVVRVVGYCLAFAPIFTLIVNILAMTYIVKAPKLKTHTRLFLFSLGICDTLVALVVMPFRLFGMLSENMEYTGELLCNLGNSLDVMLSSASIFHLCALSFDRYVSTCRPFNVGYWFRCKFSVPMFLCCWAIPATLSFGFIPQNMHIGGAEFEYRCMLERTKSCQYFANIPYSLFGTFASFVIPGIFILICNYHTLKAIDKRRRVFLKLIRVHTTRGSIYRRHIGEALFRTIFILTICFFACWSPFFIINILDPFISYKVPGYIWIAVTWFGYANSVFNPILYLKLTGVFSHRLHGK